MSGVEGGSNVPDLKILVEAARRDVADADRCAALHVTPAVHQLHRRLREVTEALAAVSAPPADDVRDALVAARNVEQYLDMLALDRGETEEPIDDGYDEDGAIQSLDAPDLRTLVAFARVVRPRGTVTDAEVDAAVSAYESFFAKYPGTERDGMRAALDAAAGVVSAGLRPTVPAPAAPTDAEVEREAHRRYDGDTVIDEETGDPISHDDWGYAECQRQAFINGAAWAQEARS